MEYNATICRSASPVRAKYGWRNVRAPVCGPIPLHSTKGRGGGGMRRSSGVSVLSEGCDKCNASLSILFRRVTTSPIRRTALSQLDSPFFQTPKGRRLHEVRSFPQWAAMGQPTPVSVSVTQIRRCHVNVVELQETRDFAHVCNIFTAIPPGQGCLG